MALEFDAVEEIASRLKLDSGAAEAVFNLFLDALAEINSEYDLARATHACTPGNPHDIIYEFYGIHEAIAEASFTKTLGSLDQTTANRLTNWVTESKSRTTYIRIDTKEVDRRSGKDSTVNLRANCQGNK